MKTQEFYIRLGFKASEFSFWTGSNFSDVVEKNGAQINCRFAKSYAFKDALSIVNKRWTEGTKKIGVKNGIVIHAPVKIVNVSHPFIRIKDPNP